MDTSIPRIARGLTFSIFGGTGAFLVWLGISREFPPPLLGLLLLYLIVLIGLAPPLSTTISLSAVSQWSWAGKRILPWEDVTEAKFEHLTLVLSGIDYRIRLPLAFFNNADDAVDFVFARLPDGVRERIAQ